MAKNTTTLSYRVTFEGKQAKDFALDLEKQMESLGAAVAATREEIAELEKAGQDTSLKKLELSGLEADLKTLRQQYKKTVTELKGYNQVLKNLSGSAYNDLTRTSTILTNALKRAEPGTKKYKQLLNQMLRVREEINKRTLSFKDLDASQEKITKMTLAMKDLDALTGEALVEQRKYWEALAKGAEEGSRHQQRYKQNLETIIAEEQRRTEAQRQAVVDNPIKYSVEQIKEAVKQTEKLRNTQPLDSDEYDKYNKQLKELEGTLKNIEPSVKNNALRADELKEALKDIKSQPLEKLEQIASQLEEELSKLAPNTKEFIRTSQNLRYVKDQMGEVKEAWQQHDGQILATIKRLSAYVAVYGSYNFIAGKLKDMVKGWLDLSDTLADVEKTTGLAHKQLAMLSKDIDAIDTRTTQEGMHQLAAVAGQIGLRSREDILGFVKAADQLTVALNELGDDGVQSLAKLAQLTGDVSRLGVEQSLLAIGSSINELSAASSAAAGPIADFMRRTGGMANMANLSSADLAALGATADALGQPIETAATAMNKFVTTLVTSTDDVAYALNLDLQEMQSLIDSGETMTAITKVLDAVRLKGDEGALGGIFKELGSEGTRMQQTMMALAENVSFLKTQVHTSRDAFAEATSVTQEYNVKNETAAAIVERIGNTVREFFVTAEGAQWLTGPLNGILDIVKALTGVSDAAAKARGSLAALFTLFVTKKWWTSLVLGLKQVNDQIKAQTIGVVGLRKVWIALKTAMSATNVISLALAAVSAAVVGIATAMAGAKKQAEQMAAALRELREQEAGEKKALDELYNSIKSLNVGQEGRAELIEKFNSKYSSYLGYLVSETADIDELTRAYKLLNAEIKLRYAQTMKEAYLKGPLEEYGAEVEKIQTRLIKHTEEFSRLNGIAQKEMLEGLGTVAYQMAKDGITGFGEEEFVEAAKNLKEFKGMSDETLQELYNLTYRGGKFGHPLYDLFKQELEMIKAEERAQSQENIYVANAERDLKDAREEAMNGIKAQVNAYAESTETIKAMKKEELEDVLNQGNTVLAYERNKADELIKIAQKTYEESVKDFPTSDKQTEEQKKQVEEAKATLAEAIDAANAPVVALQQSMDTIREVYAGDAWGKALNLPGLEKAYGNLENLGTASVDNLVQMYQSLEKAGQRYTDVNFFNEIFGEKKKVQTIDEMHAFFKDYARQIKARLKELGYTTAGNFDWSSDKGGKKKEEMKREFEAAKSLLLAYYEQRATIIKQAYLDQEITMEEKNRQITANEQEKSRALVDFYSVLLGETKKYGIEIEKILEGKDLQKLANFLNMLGPAMVDGMKLGREQSEGAIRDEAIKIREIIEKALLEGDMFGKLETEFRTMLDELSLLTSKFGSEFVAVDESTAKALVSQLTGMADEAYTMTEQELLAEAKKRSKGNETLTAWWSGVDEDQLTLILEKLKVYYDDRLEMQRRYTQRMQREWQQYYKQTGAQAEYEANKRMIEAAKNEPEGYVKGAGDYDSERGIIAAEAALEVEKIDNNIAFLQEKLKARALAINEDLATIVEAERAVLYALDPNSEEYAAQKALVEDLENRAVSLATTSGDAEAVTLNASIAEQTQNMNAIIQQSEIETTNVTLEQWQKRAEAASEWAEMVGETIGDVASLERQANRARLRGDEETARELEAQAEESKQNLVKSALNKAIDMAKVWAMELGFKVMYNALAKKSDEDVAASGAKATLKGALAEIIANGFKGAGKEVGSKGMAGLITGAVIIAAAAGLAALAKSAVNNMFPEATEGVSDGSASSPKRKLTTGMLTYANGKYPVLGNDGVVYDAEYAGANMKTGVYRKPHFGIFAEKQPEMVIDGKTTQRLVLNYPEVYNGILQLSRTGSMRTYADGNVSEFAAATSAQQQAQMEEMRLTMAATAAAVAALTERLKYPLSAEVNYFGKGGTREAEKRGGRWAKRMRVE